MPVASYALEHSTTFGSCRCGGVGDSGPKSVRRDGTVQSTVRHDACAAGWQTETGTKTHCAANVQANIGMTVRLLFHRSVEGNLNSANAATSIRSLPAPWRKRRLRFRVSCLVKRRAPSKGLVLKIEELAWLGKTNLTSCALKKSVRQPTELGME